MGRHKTICIKKRTRQVCFTIDEALLKEMREMKKKTGMAVSAQIEMRLHGYEVVKTGTGKEYDPLLHEIEV